jgi:NADPH:quinone reductase-like Zn-dependent oxidoreductase
MLAAAFSEHGPPDVLRYQELPDPVPGPADVLVRVRAVGVNRLDLDLRSGSSRMPLVLPHVLGMEAAGEIAAGGDAHGFKVGDAVIPLSSLTCGVCTRCAGGMELHCDKRQVLGVHRPGAYAEYLRVPAASVVRLPAGVSFESGAAIQTSLGAVWRALRTRAALAAGETLLVNGAGGGVGTAAVQVGHLLGATVIASAGSPEKLQRARELGADHVIDYRRESLVDRVRELTAAQGVDVVMESVGGEILQQSLQVLAPTGRLVTVGAHAGEIVDLDVIALFRNEWTLIGSVGSTREEVCKVIELVGSGALTPVVDAVMPLADAAAAHRKLEARSQVGKIVLVP